MRHGINEGSNCVQLLSNIINFATPQKSLFTDAASTG